MTGDVEFQAADVREDGDEGAPETPQEAPGDAPEPTYGHEVPSVPDSAPEPPPPAGAKFAEDGRALVTAEEFRAAVAREYSAWVAVEDISIDGTPAFRRGDPVPKSHVESGVVDKSSVVGRNTKTAEAIFSE